MAALAGNKGAALLPGGHAVIVLVVVAPRLAKVRGAHIEAARVVHHSSLVLVVGGTQCPPVCLDLFARVAVV